MLGVSSNINERAGILSTSNDVLVTDPDWRQPVAVPRRDILISNSTRRDHILEDAEVRQASSGLLVVERPRNLVVAKEEDLPAADFEPVKKKSSDIDVGAYLFNPAIYFLRRCIRQYPGDQELQDLIRKLMDYFSDDESETSILFSVDRAWWQADVLKRKVKTALSGTLEITNYKESSLERLLVSTLEFLQQPLAQQELVFSESKSFEVLVRSLEKVLYSATMRNRHRENNRYGLLDMDKFVDLCLEFIEQFANELDTSNVSQLFDLLTSCKLPANVQERIAAIATKYHLWSHPLLYRMCIDADVSGSLVNWYIAVKEKRKQLVEILGSLTPEDCFHRYDELCDLSNDLPYYRCLRTWGEKRGLEFEFSSTASFQQLIIPTDFQLGKDLDNFEVRRSDFALPYDDDYRLDLLSLYHFFRFQASHLSGFHFHLDTTEQDFPLLGKILFSSLTNAVRKNDLGTWEVRACLPPSKKTLGASDLDISALAATLDLGAIDTNQPTKQRSRTINLSDKNGKYSPSQLLFGYFMTVTEDPEIRLSALVASQNPFVFCSVDFDQLASAYGKSFGFEISPHYQWGRNLYFDNSFRTSAVTQFFIQHSHNDNFHEQFAINFPGMDLSRVVKIVFIRCIRQYSEAFWLEEEDKQEFIRSAYEGIATVFPDQVDIFIRELIVHLPKGALKRIGTDFIEHIFRSWVNFKLNEDSELLIECFPQLSVDQRHQVFLYCTLHKNRSFIREILRICSQTDRSPVGPLLNIEDLSRACELLLYERTLTYDVQLLLQFFDQFSIQDQKKILQHIITYKRNNSAITTTLLSILIQKKGEYSEEIYDLILSYVCTNIQYLDDLTLLVSLSSQLGIDLIMKILQGRGAADEMDQRITALCCILDFQPGFGVNVGEFLKTLNVEQNDKFVVALLEELIDKTSPAANNVFLSLNKCNLLSLKKKLFFQFKLHTI